MGDHGEIIACIPIRISGRATYSKYTIYPVNDINFGSILINTKKSRTLTIENKGDFDFRYNISKASVPLSLYGNTKLNAATRLIASTSRQGSMISGRSQQIQPQRSRRDSINRYKQTLHSRGPTLPFISFILKNEVCSKYHFSVLKSLSTMLNCKLLLLTHTSSTQLVIPHTHFLILRHFLHLPFLCPQEWIAWRRRRRWSQHQHPNDAGYLHHLSCLWCGHSWKFGYRHYWHGFWSWHPRWRGIHFLCMAVTPHWRCFLEWIFTHLCFWSESN